MDSPLPAEHRLLLVGEGNFSFSVAISQKFTGDSLICTSLLTREVITKLHKDAERNMKLLQEKGAQVLLEVDATKLEINPALADKSFNRVIFNFPHAGGKSNLKKNRKLLKDFFLSASQVLCPDGQIYVTLCKGQGGTPSDKPQRAWSDSWQVVAMAAHADLILNKVIPFSPEAFPEYGSTGFRSQDKHFNTEGAFIHIFMKAPPIPVTVSLEDQGTYCLKKHGHQQSWTDTGTATGRETDMNTTSTEPNQGATTLFSTKDIYTASSKGYHLSCKVRKSKHLIEKLSCNLLSDDNHPLFNIRKYLSDYIQSNSKYVLTDCGVTLPYLPTKDVQNPELHYKIQVKDLESTSLESHENLNASTNCVNVDDQNTVTSSNCDNENVKSCEGTTDTCREVFLRLSLLEQVMELSQQQQHRCVNNEEDGDGNLFVSTGVSFVKSLITPQSVPARHEMVFISNAEKQFNLQTCLIHALESMMKSQLEGHCEGQVKGQGQTGDNLDIKSQTEVQFKINQYEDCSVNDYCTTLESFFKTSETIYSIRIREQSHSVAVGLCGIPKEHSSKFVALLDLDLLTCEKWGIPNRRLLWSLDKHIRDEFHSMQNERRLFRSPSLYPLQWVHDISFWVEKDKEFKVQDFSNIIRDMAGDTVIEVNLLDTYVHPDTQRTSFCFRQTYQSLDRALSYDKSHEIQKYIRLEVARQLGVILR